MAQTDFERLYDEHAQAVFAFLLNLTRHEADTRDLLQELFVKLGFGVTSPGFATPANISNILTQSTILLLLALPMTVIIMTEGLDLSIGAVLTFASIVLAVTVIEIGRAHV